MDDTGSGLAVGSVFAGLLIVREIGRGGAGIVYLARDESLDRLVALKVLHRDSMEGDAAAAERFRNEALIAAKLEHPAIIPIYTTGVEQGRMFIAMRYVPGRSLAAYLNELAPLPVGDAVRLLRPVAAALDYAADFDIVHRDVKPANIFVDESSTVPRTMLGDFGIARAYEGTRHTATGGWVGTPEYIAPEILKDDRPDARADQYSLACVLVECVTGISPFKRSNTAATVTAQVTEQPDLESAPGIDPPTAEALQIGLEKNPDDRYASCTEFLDAVEASLTPRNTSTPNTIVRRRKRGKITRRAKMIGGIALTLIAVAAAGADFLNLRNQFSGSESRDASAAADRDAAQAEPGEVVLRADAASPGAPAVGETDVLILGTEFMSDLGSDSEPNMVFKKTQNASAVIRNLLARDPRTANAEVVVAPLADPSACPDDVRASLDSLPRLALVILDSPCVSFALNAVNDLGDAAPVTYVLASRQLDASAWPQASLAPPAFFEWARNPEHLDPRALEWLQSLGRVPSTPSMLLLSSNPYRALRYLDAPNDGKTDCQNTYIWVGPEADPNGTEWPSFAVDRALAQWYFTYPRNSLAKDDPDYPSFTEHLMHLETMTENGARPIPGDALLGTAESDRELAKAASKNKGVGCYVLFPQASAEPFLPWTAHFVDWLSTVDPTANVFIVGSRGTSRGRTWRKIVAHPSVSIAEIFPSADTSTTTWQRLTQEDGKSFTWDQSRGNAANKSEWLPMAVALMANQQPCQELSDVCRGPEGARQYIPVLPPAEWWGNYEWEWGGTSGRIFVAFDSRERAFTGDVAWMWYDDEVFANPIGTDEAFLSAMKSNGCVGECDTAD